PDSFYGGSRKTAEKELLDTGTKMLDEGATFLDVGGYSSRPGADDVPLDEELRRVRGAVEALIREIPDAKISVDTFRAEVARLSVDCGASLVNDISAGNLDTNMLSTVAALQVPYIGMHMRGNPQTMKGLVQYDDLMLDIMKYFSELLSHCNRLAINDVIIDPGFGFAKTPKQSFELLSRLEHFHHLDRPILVGVSRKSMIHKTLGITADEALNGTTVLNSVALMKGSAILRVHDVKEAAEAIKLINQLN
ncbi:MAG: dihydropteroate synthase, partial [Ekhidna sp.]|nr:dihydropteroate synthase [Ekhidna sp.]